MSDDKNEPIDHKRYFNDPEYRKRILQERKEKEESSSSAKKSSSSSSANPHARKLKRWAGGIAAVVLIFVAGYVTYLFQGLPSADEFENPETAIASEVRSRVFLCLYFFTRVSEC